MRVDGPSPLSSTMWQELREESPDQHQAKALVTSLALEKNVSSYMEREVWASS